jgi:hypothetical protein
MRPLVLFSLLAIALMAPRNASAQCTGGATGCQFTLSGQATINAVARLSISSATTPLTAPHASDFGTTTGVNTSGPTVTVLSNANYTLTSSASGWTGTGNHAKPVADLTMSINGGGFTALGIVGSAGTAPTAGSNYVIGYNTIYNWLIDTPGTYVLAINYTLTAP